MTTKPISIWGILDLSPSYSKNPTKQENNFMPRLLVLSLILLTLLPINLPQSHAQFAPTFEEIDCAEDFPFLADIENVYCGYVAVLEDRSNPNSEEIDLAVV